MTDADTATLDGLFSADLVYTHSDASSDSKQSYLDRLASGHFDYGVIEHPETSIVVRGDCALVFGDMRGEVRDRRLDAGAEQPVAGGLGARER